ncbi:MAG: S26 family signal peptidase [Acidimicrobiia bacterium]
MVGVPPVGTWSSDHTPTVVTGELRIRRFRVAEDSMRPALAPGDTLLTISDADPPIGSIVVFRHPTVPDRWLVKRVSAVSGGEAWVESDDSEATMADSRTLGWVPTHGMHRVVLRFRSPFSWARP